MLKTDDRETFYELLREINRHRTTSGKMPQEEARRWLRRLEPDPGPDDLIRPRQTLRERLDHPERKLFSYGTLQPGRKNARLLAGVNGDWLPAETRGKRWMMEGRFHAFRWEPEGEMVSGTLLVSPEINWQKLDAFEGSLYRRILIPVTLENDELLVANAYEAA